MPRPLAVQMYTLRDDVAADYSQTLRAVAELGYRAVELVTLGDKQAAELRAELDTQGLIVAGMHVELQQLEQRLPEVLNDIVTLGGQTLICPWLPPELRTSANDYRALAQRLTAIGRACHERGIQLCYHNHDFEFIALDGVRGFDVLFEAAEQGALKAELDVYWVAFAGLDPVEVIRRYGGRISHVHLKDMANDGSRTFAEVGYGSLDFPAILAACDQAGVEWLVVEQDVCRRPALESVGMSLAYLQSLGRS